MEGSMVSKEDYKERKFLLIGLLIGVLFGLIGSFISGYYFWGRTHSEDQWIVWFCLIVFVILVTIRELDKELGKLDKKSK